MLSCCYTFNLHNMLKHLPAVIMLFAVITIIPACSRPEPVADDEAKTLVASLEKSMRNENPDVLYDLFDKELLKENIKSENKDVSSAEINATITTITIKQFCDQVMAGCKNGSYKLLRMYDDNGKKHLLFRMFGDGGINYHDYSVVKINGQVKADDMYSYISGEKISKTFSDLLAANSSSNGGLASEESQKFVRLTEYKNKGEYAEEIALFKTFDTTLQNTKAMQLLYIEASKHISNDDYKNALEKFAARYPNAPNAYLLMLDAYFLNKDFDKALVAVNKLDSLVKGDPVLNLFRGNIYKELGKVEESRQSFEKCFAFDPYIKNNMQELVVAYVTANELDKAKAVIEKYKQNPRFEDADINVLYNLYPQLGAK